MFTPQGNPSEIGSTCEWKYRSSRSAREPLAAGEKQRLLLLTDRDDRHDREPAPERERGEALVMIEIDASGLHDGRCVS